MLKNILYQHQQHYSSVVQVKDSIIKKMNLTESNTELTSNIVNNTALFSTYIEKDLAKANANFGIGGYNEHRTVYSRSAVFDDATEPRRLHLGIDIWEKVDTPVFSPLAGTIHSYAFNKEYGDYGATIIVQHILDGYTFYTLYGHLALKNLSNLSEGMSIEAGQQIGNFGNELENGHWPPHLHFQIIENLDSKKGDYPGVCKYSERVMYLQNCPNPDIILQLIDKAI